MVEKVTSEEHTKRIADSFRNALILACSGVLLASMAFTTWIAMKSSNDVQACRCAEGPRQVQTGNQTVNIDGGSQYDKTVREMADQFTKARIEQEREKWLTPTTAQ